MLNSMRAGAAAAGLCLALIAGAAGAAPAGAAPAMLRAGDEGAAVVKLQRALGIPADGAFGPKTRKAVKRFQRRKGLAVDGVAGPATLSALGVSIRGRSGRAGARRKTAGGSRTKPLLRRIARCESGGDPTAVSPDGRYRGKYQFSRSTWRAMGGKGDPADAPESEQDRRAAKLLRVQGPNAWPTCSRA